MLIKILLLLFPFFIHAEESLLKQNLKKAAVGDYVVIAQGKSNTLFHIFHVQNQLLTIEEITIPESLSCQVVKSWRDWVSNNAPQNTSWVHYQIDLDKEEMKNYYSFTKNGYFTVPDADNFLSTLLKLNLQSIPSNLRRMAGPKVKGERTFWQPKMVVDGQILEGVVFDAYFTVWPKDDGPITGKTIEIYLPQNSKDYPAYFPYWLQAKGMAGQASVRVIDSGRGLFSPKRTEL